MIWIKPPPWSISLALAAALAFSGMFAAVLAAKSKPVKPALAQFQRYAPDLFDDRWQPVASVPAKKQDRLALLAPEPQPVKVERILMPVEAERSLAPQPVKTKRVMAQTPDKERARPKAKPRDVCQRHGMRKVKDGRYGWRCRR
ncbi:hypothetical protein CQ14_06585 [Bradyrhizobium lablabi]|uniref:Lectin-like protein BA14k n=1 Tax=Bradyrhizobium lablabi TaxID=722472 RepID=A0A0R3MP02_9BRAD|nr:hypothetical protein [Bradyrhizobium lablabi]KRR21310.1 hypothetical protein CQ14_06585 [Bradyrhizobium lablabi]